MSGGISSEVRSKLLNRMVAVYGSDSIRPFWDRAFGKQKPIPLSYETVSRIFSEKRGAAKGVTATTLAMICEALDFTQDEVRDILRDHEATSGRIQDRGFWKLVGQTVNELSNEERDLLDAFRAIKEHSPEQVSRMADMVETVAQAGGVIVSLDSLRRKKKGGR